MFVIRRVRESDLDALERFAHNLSLGMLSLPRDRGMLKKKITKSIKSFSKNVTSPEDEYYLFVLENYDTSEAVGTCGIYSKTAVDEPFYYFRLETFKTKREELPIPEVQKILHPAVLTHGPSELCSLYLERSYRKEGLGELLSLSRFLFIAENPHRFDPVITARLRGYINKTKETSPFWDALGKHFLYMDFKDAHQRQHFGSAYIAKFLPKYPIYATLLPKQAQIVIQKTHPTTRPALRMLRNEGMKINDQVDIFEGGPVVEAKMKNVRTVKRNTRAYVEEIISEPIESRRYIISNTSTEYRACYGTVSYTSQKGAVIEKRIAEALKVKRGDFIRFIPTQKG